MDFSRQDGIPPLPSSGISVQNIAGERAGGGRFKSPVVPAVDGTLRVGHGQDGEDVDAINR
jgi:hypothetical protein